MPRCEVVGLDFVDRAGVVIKADVELAANPAQVWQVLNDTDRWPEWFDGMKTAAVTSPKWDGVGSTRSVRVGPLVVDEQMITWQPDQQWGFCATRMNALGWIAKRMVEIVDITPNGSGSTVVYTGALDPLPWIKPFSGLLKKQMTNAWATSLPNIDGQIR